MSRGLQKRGLQAELKQRVPFTSREQEAYLSLLRTADALQARVEARLKEFGLTGTQYNALRILRGAGPEGLPCCEIGERMITHDPDITRLLNRLEDRGFVERTRARHDRRRAEASTRNGWADRKTRARDSPSRRTGKAEADN
jgi:DNA-binding MarR family transcriptional regulator